MNTLSPLLPSFSGSVTLSKKSKTKKMNVQQNLNYSTPLSFGASASNQPKTNGGKLLQTVLNFFSPSQRKIQSYINQAQMPSDLESTKRPEPDLDINEASVNRLEELLRGLKNQPDLSKLEIKTYLLNGKQDQSNLELAQSLASRASVPFLSLTRLELLEGEASNQAIDQGLSGDVFTPALKALQALAEKEGSAVLYLGDLAHFAYPDAGNVLNVLGAHLESGSRTNNIAVIFEQAYDADNKPAINSLKPEEVLDFRTTEEKETVERLRFLNKEAKTILGNVSITVHLLERLAVEAKGIKEESELKTLLLALKVQVEGARDKKIQAFTAQEMEKPLSIGMKTVEDVLEKRRSK